MRNLFDQYTQNENKLTHALVTALYEDTALCKSFLAWITGRKRATPKINVIEQQLVGEPELAEDEAERRGLPDAWFYDDQWSLLIESKVAAPLTKDQLVRHYNTALRRDFSDITVLALTVQPQKKDFGLDYVKYCCWSELYLWLKKQALKSEWALKVCRFMEVADSTWAANGYLKEGTLTVFTGIPFTYENPYNYREAKLYLKQAMEELRMSKGLVRTMKLDATAPGRGAIKGKNSHSVWDFIPLKQTEETKSFTHYPHLTLYLDRDKVGAIISVPNSLHRPFRKNLVALGSEGFFEVMSELNKNLAICLKKAPDAVPIVTVLQRHYRTQSSPAVLDAHLEFDLRTAFPTKSKSPVKIQKEWLEAAYQALINKKSNIHLSVGMVFPYDDGVITNDVKILDRVSEVWIACKPLIKCIEGQSTTKL
tara:strand:- start:2279 stop:3550 length:1272 start_codon:yes stop_codon:yes gene_type:complete